MCGSHYISSWRVIDKNLRSQIFIGDQVMKCRLFEASKVGSNLEMSTRSITLRPGFRIGVWTLKEAEEYGRSPIPTHLPISACLSMKIGVNHGRSCTDPVLWTADRQWNSCIKLVKKAKGDKRQEQPSGSQTCIVQNAGYCF